jgi:hypothetical protein
MLKPWSGSLTVVIMSIVALLLILRPVLHDIFSSGQRPPLSAPPKSRGLEYRR